MANFNYLHDTQGLQFIPVDDNKRPLVKEWSKSPNKHNLNSYGVGLVCGELSGNLEVIDFDLKNLNDNTFPLMTKYKEAVNLLDAELINLMTIQKTKNGGYHFLYRCEKIAPSIELANVPPNKVIIETRGEGGQVVIAPTEGYSFIKGNLSSIKTITEQQREILFSVAISFNEVVKLKEVTQFEKDDFKKDDSCFADYNNRADIIALLEKHGWNNTTQKGNKIHLRRPGNTTAEFSGNYDIEKRWFSVFTTSTEFTPNRAYQPYAVYAMLEHKGDYSAAAKELLKQGYGTYKPLQKELTNLEPTKKPTSKLNLEDDDFSFIGNFNDAKENVFKRQKGTFKRGVSVGYPNSLDRHYLLKEGELAIVHGIDNVGKSVWIWHNALVSALLHGWKWVIFSAENSHDSFLSKMCEFYWCQTITDLSDEHIVEATNFVENHFIWIKSDEELYSYHDILVMAKKIHKKSPYNAFLIDPYNSLKIHEGNKLSEHTYHYEAISELKLFTKNYKCCMYINAHAHTAAQRIQHGQNEIPAPMKADIEGGAKFGAKADLFITLHRHVGDKEKYMDTQVHVRKVKETETGGKVTPFAEPVILTATHGVTMFKDESGHSPIAKLRGQIKDTYGSRLLTPIRDITEAKKESQTVMYNPNTQEFVPITNNETNEPIPF